MSFYDALLFSKGQRGERGYSAYEIAVQNGYEGTEEEWTNSFLSSAGYYTKTETDNKLKKKAYYFDNVASMKNATNLQNGDFVITLGYYDANDGGGADYLIRTKTQDDVDDGGIVHFLSEDLVAEFIQKNNTVNVKQFGAKGDGITDDTNVLKKMFDKCRELNITSIYIPKGEYIVSDTLLEYGINGLCLIGENDDIYNSTIIMRNADKTIFNFGGIMELTGVTYRSNDLLMKNLTFRDKKTTFTQNVFATLHYTQHFTIQNCTIGCRNKSLDLKHCYDSRFINCDFVAGGNIDDAMITLHGGKHASDLEIGWDSANCITFECCRFERYFGAAIKTTKEVQPSNYNQEYDPCIAENVNTIWLDLCRFEAPSLKEGKHLDFVFASSLRLNLQMTILDGQPNLQPINFDNCVGVYGRILTSYNQSNTFNPTFENFEQPIINILNNSGKFNLDLIVTTVYNHYLLDYFVNIEGGNNNRRTININLIYDGTNKKIYNQGSSNQNLNIYKQGRETRYGKYENGFGWKVDNDKNNSYFNNMTYDSSNDRYSLQNRYISTSNTARTNDEYISNDNFTYHKNNCGVLFDGSLMIMPNKYPSTEIPYYRGSSSSGRTIMFSSSYPTEEILGTTFRSGDIIFKTVPTAGSNIGWVCVSSGNPGTWKPFGTIEN